MEEKEFPPESAGGLMVTAFPSAGEEEKVEDVLQTLSLKDWGNIPYVYIVSKKNHLLGFVSISKILSSAKDKKVKELIEKPKLTILPFVDQEKVVIEAIREDLETVPVVDKEGKLLGIILSDKLIDVLHSEHLEDFLRSLGIRGKGSHILELATANIFHVIKERLPWLVIGLFGGLGLGLVASRFETSLSQNIALAFFIPVIAYIADSVGAQTGTIFIRAMTVLKINVLHYILKELVTGIFMGLALGFLGGVGAMIISQSYLIGVVVGISLFLAITVSTLLGCIVPITLKFFKKDPALGSGPLATVIQDIISLTLYFLVASLIL